MEPSVVEEGPNLLKSLPRENLDFHLSSDPSLRSMTRTLWFLFFVHVLGTRRSVRTLNPPSDLSTRVHSLVGLVGGLKDSQTPTDVPVRVSVSQSD